MTVSHTRCAMLSTAEVARRLGVNPTSVTRWCKAGLLPHLKIGGVLRFDWTDVLGVVQRPATVAARDPKPTGVRHDG